MLDYLGSDDGRDIQWQLIRAACASVADTAIYPLQDVLGLGGEHRMNRPGTGEGCWEWRFGWDQVQPLHAQRAVALAQFAFTLGTSMKMKMASSACASCTRSYEINSIEMFETDSARRHVGSWFCLCESAGGWIWIQTQRFAIWVTRLPP